MGMAGKLMAQLDVPERLIQKLERLAQRQGLPVETFLEMALNRLDETPSEYNPVTLFNETIAVLCIANLDGYFLHVNPALERLLDCSREELLAVPFVEYIHPDDVPLTLNELDRLKRGLVTSHFENRYRRKDGVYKWLAWTSVVRDGLIYATGQDITPQKEAQLALARSHEEVNIILESIGDAFFTLDQDWNFRYLNTKAERLLLRKRADLIGKNVWQEFPEAIDAAFYREYHRAVAEYTPVSFVEFYPPLHTWFEVSAYPSDVGLSVYFRDVSDIKKAAIRLETSEQYFRSLFDHNPDGVYSYDLDGRFVEVNKGIEQLTGYSRDELLYMTFEPIIVPEDYEVSRIAFEKAAQGEPQRYEATGIRKDGTRFDIDVAKLPIVVNGQITGVFGIAKNITARKQAERELTASEHRYRTMFQANPHTMWVVDQETLAFLDVNDAAVHRYGYSRDEFLSMTLADIRPPEDVLAMTHIVKNTMGFHDAGIWRHKKKDGTLIEVHISSNRLIYKGHPAVVGLVVDVTEQRKMEVERARYVRQLQELARASLQIGQATSLEGMLRIAADKAREIIGANQAVTSMTTNHNWAQAITSVSMSERYTQWKDYATIPDGSGIYALVCETNTPMRLTHDALVQHPRWRGFGEHAAQHPPMNGWLAAPFVNRSGENIGLIQLSDKEDGEFTQDDENMLVQVAQLVAAGIDNMRLYEKIQQHAAELEQRVAERTFELVQANEKLQELDRLKSKFVSNVSHELRNPITSLNLKLELMKRGGPESVIQHLGELDRQINRLMELTNSILDLSRLELARDKITFGPVDMKMLVQQICETYQSNAEAAGLTLELDQEADLPPVRGEINQLSQVLTNLIENAIKYTPSGRVEVKTYRVSDADRVCFIVKDTGIGIDKEDLPHLFDRFYRGRRVHQMRIPGTGLGLPIVDEIIALHDGHIEVESEVGKGTTIRVYLPAARDVSKFTVNVTGNSG